MTLLFMDGFDHYASKSDLHQLWNGNLDLGNSVTYVSTSYRRGSVGKGFRPHYTDTAEILLPAQKSTIYFGAAIRWDTGTTRDASYPFLMFRTSAANQVTFHMENTTSKITAWRGTGTLLGTADIATTLAVWHSFQVKVIFSNTVGQVKIKLDGKVVLNLTGIDTANTLEYCDRVRLGANHNWWTRYDDMWIDDAKFHGDCRVRTFAPDADGVHTDFAASAGNRYECVDDTDLGGDADYVYGNGLGSKVSFGITTGALNGVKAIQPLHAIKKSNVGFMALKPIIRSGGADYTDPKHALPTSYIYAHKIHETDPDDAQPWTQTKLEAAEFGVEITQMTTTTTTTTTTTI
ncbi:MAG: hypothetical protein ACYTEU_11970 [Planctomycetota bacterium]|jgi:hypothetical protein